MRNAKEPQVSLRKVSEIRPLTKGIVIQMGTRSSSRSITP